MSERDFVFTSESVTEGHPDKICDQISDAVLDAIIRRENELAAEGYVTDKGSRASADYVRVACETLITTGLVVVAGEIRTHAYVDIPKIVRETIKDIGYTRAKFGFDHETCGVITSIDEQSCGHRPGCGRVLRGPARRRRRPARLGGRWRPGHDVRLRLQRDLGAHADADPPRAEARRAPHRRPQGRHAAVPASRRQDAGDRALRGRQAGRGHERPHIVPARGRRRHRHDDEARLHRAHHQAGHGGRGREVGRARRST